MNVHIIISVVNRNLASCWLLILDDTKPAMSLLALVFSPEQVIINTQVVMLSHCMAFQSVVIVTTSCEEKHILLYYTTSQLLKTSKRSDTTDQNTPS